MSDLKEARYELIEIPEPFGPVHVTVTDQKVRSYAFAQGDYGSWYFSGSPFGAPVAHPLVLANDLLFLFYDKYDGNTAEGLHTHELLRFHSPIDVGETVTITGAYTEQYERRGQGYVVLEAEARGSDGRLLVEHVGREIMRTVAGSIVGGARTAGESRPRTVAGVADTSLPIAVRAAADLPNGSPLPNMSRSFDQDQMSTFSWAGRGFANVHTSAAKAEKAGLPSTIVQAQQQIGLVIENLVQFFGESWFTSGELDVRFVSPAYKGEQLTTSGAITKFDGERLELEVWIDKEDGTRTALGWASAELGRDSDRPTPLLPTATTN